MSHLATNMPHIAPFEGSKGHGAPSDEPVDKVEESEHILQRNESAHQYFRTFPPTPTHGLL